MVINMNKNTILIFFILSVFVFCGTEAFGDLIFLDMNGGARARSMGGAFTGLADDVNCLAFNPAGLSLQKGKRTFFSLTHTEMAAEIRNDCVDLIFPSSIGQFGTELLAQWMPDEPGVDLQGDSIGYLSYMNYAIGVSYSRMFGIFPVGATVKFAGQKIADKSLTACALDMGILVPGSILNSGNFNAGFTIRNLGIGSTGAAPPLSLTAGTSYKIPIGKGDHLTAAIDAILLSPTGFGFNSGLEYRILKSVSLRGGANYSDSSISWTLGSGLSFGSGTHTYSFDYGLAVPGIGSIFHMIQFVMSWNGN